MLNVSEISVDLACRKLAMASFLYYGCAVSAMSDGEYDALSKFVAHNWQYVPEEWQERFSTDREILASGHHILIPQATYHGALSWAEHLGLTPEVVPAWNPEFEQELHGTTISLMGMPG